MTLHFRTFNPFPTDSIFYGPYNTCFFSSMTHLFNGDPVKSKQHCDNVYKQQLLELQYGMPYTHRLLSDASRSEFSYNEFIMSKQLYCPNCSKWLGECGNGEEPFTLTLTCQCGKTTTFSCPGKNKVTINNTDGEKITTDVNGIELELIKIRGMFTCSQCGASGDSPASIQHYCSCPYVVLCLYCSGCGNTFETIKHEPNCPLYPKSE